MNIDWQNVSRVLVVRLRSIGDTVLSTPSLIALSGYSQADDRRRSEASGFAYHLVKPLDIDALLDVLDKLAPGERPAPP